MLLVELLHSPNPAVLLAAAEALLELAKVRCVISLNLHINRSLGPTGRPGRQARRQLRIQTCAHAAALCDRSWAPYNLCSLCHVHSWPPPNPPHPPR